MKITSFLFIIICLSVLAGETAKGQETNKITTGIKFVNVPADKVLDIYVASAKSQVIIASDVQQATHRITLEAAAVSPEVAHQMIEQALLNQAGIVITRLDDKRISVTYNDRLELER